MTKHPMKSQHERNLPSMLSDFFNTDKLLDWNLPAMFNQAKFPPVNIKETEKEFLIDVAAPGLKKENFKIKTDQHTLTISAEEENYTRHEYSYNSFSRSFSLPEYVVPEETQASYKNGILSLSLPKKEEKQKNGSKEISIS
jgi:HSP20 family protein